MYRFFSFETLKKNFLKSGSEELEENFESLTTEGQNTTGLLPDEEK